MRTSSIFIYDFIAVDGSTCTQLVRIRGVVNYGRAPNIFLWDKGFDVDEIRNRAEASSSRARAAADEAAKPAAAAAPGKPRGGPAAGVFSFLCGVSLALTARDAAIGGSSQQLLLLDCR